MAVAGRLRLCPSFLAEQRNKSHIGEVFAAIFVLRDPRHPHQFLNVRVRTNRDHQPAADFQLVFERLRNRRTAGRDYDCIVRRVLRPTLRPVTVQDMDVVVAKIGERRGGLFGQWAVTLDGIDIGGNFGKNRRRIARAGTDFEDLFAATQRQCLGHEGDDIGLRDCLAFFDWQRSVIVSKLAKMRRQEAFTGHTTHGV